MAWNEPPKDPKKEPGPPDLDEALRKLQQKIASAFGGRKSSDESSSGGKGVNLGQFGGKIIIAALFLLWFLSGIFIVDPAEEAVILHFGKYSQTLGPGPHWIPRFIDSKYVVDVQSVSNYTYSAEMLNKEESIVSVSVAVQYRVGNTRDYLFDVQNPQESLQQATASALRQVIGNTTLNDVLTVGREEVRTQVLKHLNKILDIYKTGITVTDVNILTAKAPDEVLAAFDDATKAQQDMQRYVDQATAYAAQVEPIAKGQAQRITQEADAYKKQIILEAEGQVAPFLAMLPQYLSSPVVTKERLYLDAVTAVLSKSTKVLVDLPGGTNFLNIPFDKLIANNETAVPTMSPKTTGDNAGSGESDANNSRPTRDSYQGRGGATNENN